MENLRIGGGAGDATKPVERASMPLFPAQVVAWLNIFNGKIISLIKNKKGTPSPRRTFAISVLVTMPN